MHLTRAARSFASWIACLGVLMAALAPTLSEVLRDASSPEWVTVCSQTGARVVDLDERHDSNPAHHAGAAFEHCPYCTLHATGAGPLPRSSATVALLALSFATPRFALAVGIGHVEWAAPQSRGPPLFA